MNTRLTLSEKLKDLRTGKKLKLDDVSEATGISKSTLQRLEADEDISHRLSGYRNAGTVLRCFGGLPFRPDRLGTVPQCWD